jgi:hypothetical protein
VAVVPAEAMAVGKREGAAATAVLAQEAAAGAAAERAAATGATAAPA